MKYSSDFYFRDRQLVQLTGFKHRHRLFSLATIALGTSKDLQDQSQHPEFLTRKTHVSSEQTVHHKCPWGIQSGSALVRCNKHRHFFDIFESKADWLWRLCGSKSLDLSKFDPKQVDSLRSAVVATVCLI